MIPLLSSIEGQAKEWKQVLGNYLLSDTVQAMNQLKTQIEAFRGEIELVVTGLERFMSIMQAITDVRNMAIQAEVQYLSCQECFRTMRTHAIEFSPSDEAMAYELQRNWESLYLGAFYRASTLESTIEKFAELIQDEIRQFLDETVKFIEDFEMHGPGSTGDDLELGLKKMDVRLKKKYNSHQLLFFLNFFKKLNNTSLMRPKSQLLVIAHLLSFGSFIGIWQTDQQIRGNTFEPNKV